MLNLLKQDIQALFLLVIVIVSLLFWPISYNYLKVAEVALRTPVVFFAFLGSLAYYSIREKRRINQRLRTGWLVKGNTRI